MQAKAAEEGEKEEKLYEKFMCYCENKECDLTGSTDLKEPQAMLTRRWQW